MYNIVAYLLIACIAYLSGFLFIRKYFPLHCSSTSPSTWSIFLTNDERIESNKKSLKESIDNNFVCLSSLITISLYISDKIFLIL